MKNILVITGGAGFIGSNLISELLKFKKYKIISIDNYSSGLFKNHFKNNRVKYLKGSTKNIEILLKSYVGKIHTIFHFGEFARIYQSFKKINDCFDSNIEGTPNVFNFALNNKIRLIYSATSASLGNNQEDQHLSPYAYSKSVNMNLIMNLNKWFNNFKIRASYGEVGSVSSVSNFASLSTFGSGQYGLGNPTLFFSQAGNKDLQWEKSEKFDIGASFAILKNKVNIEIGYYKTNLTDLVIDVPTPPSLGIPGNTISANAASMYNKGIELAINASIIEKKDFNYYKKVLNIFQFDIKS